jgi:hypothetical protein
MKVGQPNFDFTAEPWAGPSLPNRSLQKAEPFALLQGEFLTVSASTQNDRQTKMGETRRD